MSDYIGKTLKNQYYLSRLAGRGGMADVYLAFDRVRSTPMAVKVLRRDLASHQRFKEAFKKEARLLEELQHPNIVRFYEFEARGDPVFIVMDWVNGGNLRQRIDAAGRAFSLKEVLQILEPVCKALSFAHNLEYFHCDVKPSNIMLHENGQDVYLTDFGVARLAAEKKGGGTPPYMAPEQFADQVSAQTDIYSLGVAVYEMLSGGRLPFRGDSKSPGSTTRERYEWEHKNLTFPPLSQFNRSLPRPLLDVVERALHKDPRQRFPSAIAFGEAFKNSLDASTLIVPPPPERDRTLYPQGPETAVPERRPAPAPPPRPGARMLFGRSGDLAGQSLPLLRQETLIGRGVDCDLRLQERSVSRRHATILITKRGVYLRDESSALGTYVNGQRIPAGMPVTLKSGDVIQLGHYQVFEFRAG